MKCYRLVVAMLGLLAGATTHAADEPPTPCRVPGLKHEVLCGRVDRALDPAQPGGVRIEVHYVVLPAPARGKRPDPIFFFAGGPGQSAIALAPTFAATVPRLTYRRDLVFIDQRGVGRSAPLSCDDLGDEEARRPIADRIDVQRGIDRLAVCMKRLQALPHGDLRQYTTTIAMADAEAVRAVLGAERINLVGGSYGTRAVLEYLRQQPQRVRRAVIDGVAPPDMSLPASLGRDTAAALRSLFDDCRRETACAGRHPRLAANWTALLARPSAAVRVADPADGRIVDLAMTPELLAAMVRGPLYQPALASALPFAIDEAAAGRWQPMVGLAVASAGGGSRAGRIAEGMHFSVVCTEDMTAGAPGVPAAGADPDTAVLQTTYARPYRELCPGWPRGGLPADFYRVGPSTSPVLAFSGGIDPATPPRHAQRVVQALGAKARHLVAPHLGHGVMTGACGRELVQAFIDAETEAAALAIDAGCLARMPRPPAFEPPGSDARTARVATKGSGR